MEMGHEVWRAIDDLFAAAGTTGAMVAIIGRLRTEAVQADDWAVLAENTELANRIADELNTWVTPPPYRAYSDAAAEYAAWELLQRPKDQESMT